MGAEERLQQLTKQMELKEKNDQMKLMNPILENEFSPSKELTKLQIEDLNQIEELINNKQKKFKSQADKLIDATP